MSSAYLGIGSNLGAKRHNIDIAIALLDGHSEILVSKVSSYYETEPVDYLNQDWFINCVVEIETALSPYRLLDFCQEIEAKLKRERLVRFGPRTIDIDILLYEGYCSKDEALTIPHPRMTERSFVLIPLYEIAGEIKIGESSIEKLLAGLANLEDQNPRSVIKLCQ